LIGDWERQKAEGRRGREVGRWGGREVGGVEEVVGLFSPSPYRPISPSPLPPCSPISDQFSKIT